MAVPKTELHRLSATQAAELIRTNQLSAEEYAKALLERVGERDPRVRAWVYLDENAVLEQARKLDAIPVEKRGPLHGIAVGIKDIFLTQGTQFTCCV
jgi:Asp-tRNA(Asn)/Glu-tRNA(Gln) amidotransferase A subunit family amidase